MILLLVDGWKKMSDFEPLDFEKEGIVLDYKTAGVDIDCLLYTSPSPRD